MNVGVFSPVFPNSMRFIETYFKGIEQQEHPDFTLWLALDRLAPQDVIGHIPDGIDTEIVPARTGDTPARLRERVWTSMASSHDLIVMVDSDDVPGPGRVAAAVENAEEADVSACALEIIDGDGVPLGATLRPPDGIDPERHVLEWNVFGLSNTAYKAGALRQLLPLPRDVRLVDWYLFTLGQSLGQQTYFDTEPHLAYRQYEANTARILPPLSVDYVRRAAHLVSEQLSSVAAEHERRDLPAERIVSRLKDVLEFAALDDASLTVAIDRHEASGHNCYLWWEYVAPAWWVAGNRTD